jgi:hypothetical protein
MVRITIERDMIAAHHIAICERFNIRFALSPLVGHPEQT